MWLLLLSTGDNIAEIKKYVINPVECREAVLQKPETLAIQYEIPTEVAIQRINLGAAHSGALTLAIWKAAMWML